MYWQVFEMAEHLGKKYQSMEISVSETKEATVTGKRNDRLFTKGDRVTEQYLHACNNENTVNKVWG